MIDDSFIDYGKLIDEAMHIIVHQVLLRVAKDGLPGGHHFYISFLTNHPKVEVSDRLRRKYPEDMTIVLQHQFEELKITEDTFSVVLSFEGIKERVLVPFDALTAFADPSVKFGLQFRSIDEFEDDEEEILSEVKEFLPAQEEKKSGTDEKKKLSPGESNVVSIDSFRKK